MHPFHHAQSQPDKPAYIMAGSGETVTYGQLTPARIKAPGCSAPGT